MSVSDMRAALAQHEANQSVAVIGMLGFAGFAIFAGMWTDSWIIGVAAFVLPLVLLVAPGLQVAVTAGFALLWAYLGLRLGLWIGGAGMGLVAAAILGCIGLAATMTVAQVMEDQNRDDAPSSPVNRPLREPAEASLTQAFRENTVAQPLPLSSPAWALVGVILFGLPLAITELSRHTPSVADHTTAQSGQTESTPRAPISGRSSATRSVVQDLPRTTASPPPGIRLSPGLDKYEIVACVEAARRDPVVAQSVSVEELALGCAVLQSR